MMNERRIFAESNGNAFEDNLIEAISSRLRNKNQLDRLVIHSDDDLDRFQGTDFEIDGVRADATCAFSHKDHMANTDFEPLYTPYGDLKFGIRTGNSHNGYTKFEKPVVVVGMDLDDWYAKTYENAISEYISKMAPMIISYIKECYNEYVTA